MSAGSLLRFEAGVSGDAGYSLSPAGSVTVPAGQLTAPPVTLRVADDQLFELDQTVALRLLDYNGGATPALYAVAGAPAGSSAVVISDDDPEPAGSVSLGFDTVERVHEGQQLRFKVSVPAPVAGTEDLVVSYRVVSSASTAVYGTDYTLAGDSPQATNPTAATLAGTVRLEPGTREAFVVLHAAHNTGQDAPDETVALRLTGTSGADGYTLGVADTATATIYDGMSPVASVTYHKTANPPNFTISLNPQADRDITVNYTATGTGITPGNRTAEIAQDRSFVTVSLADDLGIAGAPPDNLTLTLTSCAANACTISTTRPSDGE